MCIDRPVARPARHPTLGAVVCVVALVSLVFGPSVVGLSPNLAEVPLPDAVRPAASDPYPEPDPDPELPPATLPRFGRPVYHDVTAEAGLAGFLHAGYLGPGNREEPAAVFIEAMGPGACWLDFDGDGWLDLYLVNGRYHTHTEKNALLDPHSQLHRNNGDGTFTDVTEPTGTALRGDHQGCAAADVDNDGDADLWVTGWGGNALFRNNGDGTFTDIADSAGVRMATCTGHIPCWSTSVAFLDADRDGCLDAYLGHFEELDLTNPPPINGPGEGQKDRFFLGDCTGTFTNVTEEAGFWDVKHNTWSMVAMDLDSDGDTDLYSSNDGDPNGLWINDGTGTFTRQANSVAADPLNGMGTAVGDFDRSGRPDIVTTNWHGTNNGIYRDTPTDFEAIGHRSPFDDARPHSGWATHWFDMNRDGHLDLMVVNSNTENLGDHPVAQPLLAYEQDDDGWFRSARTGIGADFLTDTVGRGAAWADYDNDGDVDMQISQAGENPTVLLRAEEVPGNFLAIRLVGTAPGVTRDAVGTKVTVYGPGLAPQTLEKTIGSGFMSSNDPRLHFGAADLESVTVNIRWPDGSSVTHHGVRTNTILTAAQGQPLVVERASPFVRVAAATEVVDRLAPITIHKSGVPGDHLLVDSWWTLPDGTIARGDSVTVSFADVGWQVVKATYLDASGRTASMGYRFLVTDDIVASIVPDKAVFDPQERPQGRVLVAYGNGDPVANAQVNLSVRYVVAETAFGEDAGALPNLGAYTLGWKRMALAGETDAVGAWRFHVPHNLVRSIPFVAQLEATHIGEYVVTAAARAGGLPAEVEPVAYQVMPSPSS